jgi:DNA-binding transcriptional LysR family regulator
MDLLFSLLDNNFNFRNGSYHLNLNEIVIFVKIVEVGSFIGAARALDMPKSTISAKLTSLEKRLGVTLIRRTTRKLHITDGGEAYYNQCLKALAQIMAAEEQVTQNQSAPHGQLRLTAPVELGAAILPPVIEEFSRIYPDVNLDIILTDRAVDLVEEGIDIGIRAGHLRDSSLISKRLGTIYFAPFASAKYLRRNKEPKTPKDLEGHCVITFSPLGSEEWQLVSQREKQTVQIKKRLVTNDLHLIKALTVSGMGISLIPTFLCYQEAKTGKLIRVLENWRSETRPVHFVYPAQKYVSPKIKAFIDVATGLLKKHLEITEL